MRGLFFIFTSQSHHTKKKIHILTTFTAIFFFSCSSGTGKKADTTRADSTAAVAAVYDSTLAKGRVTDSVACGAQSYALYLPSYYTISRKFPCIYFFDAHARGSLPVNSYKAAAEKYGFVLIGSNASKNGTDWQLTNEQAKALIANTRSRINIDPQRIYTSGFSGGSRVACAVAMVDGGVAGVIGCAAGAPAAGQGSQNKFDYFGIVGDHDFNLAEMQQWDLNLAENGFSHGLLTTGGTHGWATVSDFETALLWMQVNAMNEQVQTKNDSLVAAFKNDCAKRITAAKAGGEWVRVRELLEGAVSAFNGSQEAVGYKKQIQELVAGNDYQNAVAEQRQLQQVELVGQHELGQEFTTQDESWWTKKINELNQKSRNAKSKQEAQMNGRLLAYLGFVAYMNSSKAIKSGDVAQAERYLRIFKRADPKNPDVSYLAATCYMQKGNAKQAIEALNEAVVLGYNDVLQLRSDPAFSSLKNEDGFQKVITKAIANNSLK